MGGKKGKVPKNQRIEGVKNTYIHGPTGEVVTFVHHVSHRIYPEICDGSWWEKPAGEGKEGEEFEALLNFIQAPLEKLEHTLDRSPVYYEAKSAVCVINSQGIAIPQVRYHLIRGLLRREELAGRIDSSDLEKKLLKAGDMDFSPADYDLMTDYLHGFLEARCAANGLKCVTRETLRYRYLSGDGLFPEEWEYFRLFCEINPDFEPFTQGWRREIKQEDDGRTTIFVHVYGESKAYFYDIFVKKRRDLRRRLEMVHTEIERTRKPGEPPDIRRILQRHYEVPSDSAPELKLIFEEFVGEESQRTKIRLTRSQPLTREQYLAETRKQLQAPRQNIVIVANKAPPCATHKKFDEYPLCCVNGLLGSIFEYSLLKYLWGDFEKMGLPHYWVAELEAVVLYQDGVINPFTKGLSIAIRDNARRVEGAIGGDQMTEEAFIGVERHKKRPVLFELAERVRHAISFGEFDSLLALSAGQFISFYNVFKRTTLALPDGYWEFEEWQYKMNHHMAGYKISLPGMRKGEREEQWRMRTDCLREEAMRSQKERFEELYRRVLDIRHRIYPKGHETQALPWAFFLHPVYTGGDIHDWEDLDIMDAIVNPDKMRVVINDGDLWSRRSSKPYSREETEKILIELRLPELMKVIHPNNFLEKTPGYDPMQVLFLGRILWYHDGFGTPAVANGTEGGIVIAK